MAGIKVTSILLSLMFPMLSYGKYWQTLPKGVRLFAYRHVISSTIKGSYGSDGGYRPYELKANINADSIAGFNSYIDTYLAGLTQNQYDNLSFGEYQGSAESKVHVNGIGLGYGFSSTLTGYFSIPHYTADVRLKINRLKSGNHDEVVTDIQTNQGVVIENLPDFDAQVLQSVFVNYYGYQPIGDWRAKGFGDLELGLMKRLVARRRWGLLLTGGVVAPTGREDDPDILQDISFGDGQWDIFMEFGGGYRLARRWEVDSWMRYTYQLPYNREIRLPESADFPITSRKGMAKISLGSKLQYNLAFNFFPHSAWTLTPSYTFDIQGETLYTSDYPEADSILRTDTKTHSHTWKFNINYSTVRMFKKKKFPIPLQLNISTQFISGGHNTPKYQRADFEFRMFF